jgi:hypothetical protein
MFFFSPSSIIHHFTCIDRIHELSMTKQQQQQQQHLYEEYINPMVSISFC